MCAVGQGSLPELSGEGQTGIRLGEGSARAQTAGGCAGARAGVWWAPETAVTQTAGPGLSVGTALQEPATRASHRAGAAALEPPSLEDRRPLWHPAPGTLAVSLRRLEAWHDEKPE